MKKRTKRKIQKRVFTLLLLIIVAALGYFFGTGDIPMPPRNQPTVAPLPAEGYLSVHYLDVGQADSILLACNGEYMLIDAGNKGDGPTVVNYLKALDITQLDYVVGSHPHEDHMGDMDEVLKNFETEVLWTPTISGDSLDRAYIKDFLAAAEDQNLTPVQPELGQTYPLGDAVITVLGPVKDYSDPNNQSLILMVQFGSNRFLFTGDAEKEAESDMLSYWGEDYNFKTDVLKAGHHGSSTSTSYLFLRQTDPTWAVIPVGHGNSYGHPNKETLDILQQAEVTVYRTDLLGTIVATSDGTDITFDWAIKE